MPERTHANHDEMNFHFTRPQTAYLCYCFMAKGAKDDQSKATEWVLDSGCTNHMIGDKNLLMDAPLSLSHLKHIIFADKGKSQVLGLGKVAITKDRHMDKVMLVES